MPWSLPPRSHMTDPTWSTFPWPHAAKGANVASSDGRVWGKDVPLGSGSWAAPVSPNPGPFLPPAQSLRGMIQQKPGSHQLLLQPESSEVSLGSVADLCNQGEVVWGARKMRDRICSAIENGGELSCILLGVKNIISSLESLWLCMDKGWVMQKQWLYWESQGSPLWARTQGNLEPTTLVQVPFLFLLYSKAARFSLIFNILCWFKVQLLAQVPIGALWVFWIIICIWFPYNHGQESNCFSFFNVKEFE